MLGTLEAAGSSEGAVYAWKPVSVQLAGWISRICDRFPPAAVLFGREGD